MLPEWPLPNPRREIHREGRLAPVAALVNALMAPRYGGAGNLRSTLPLQVFCADSMLAQALLSHRTSPTRAAWAQEAATSSCPKFGRGGGGSKMKPLLSSRILPPTSLRPPPCPYPDSGDGCTERGTPPGHAPEYGQIAFLNQNNFFQLFEKSNLEKISFSTFSNF